MLLLQVVQNSFIFVNPARWDQKSYYISISHFQLHTSSEIFWKFNRNSNIYIPGNKVCSIRTNLHYYARKWGSQFTENMLVLYSNKLLFSFSLLANLSTGINFFKSLHRCKPDSNPTMETKTRKQLIPHSFTRLLLQASFQLNPCLIYYMHLPFPVHFRWIECISTNSQPQWCNSHRSIKMQKAGKEMIMNLSNWKIHFKPIPVKKMHGGFYLSQNRTQ